jgi:hypothetical protein
LFSIGQFAATHFNNNRKIPIVQEDNTAIRRHVRHVTGIPVEVSLDFNHSYQTGDDSITNVSLGGLCFIASDRLDINDSIQVRFPVLKQEKSLEGKVVWCSKTPRGYEVGLEFSDPAEVERLKMIEQICLIESFRKEQEQRGGRRLSSEQAAREWVNRYAGEFSALN